MDQDRKLAAIVFTDIVNYTEIMSKDESLGYKYITQHNSLISEHILSFKGELLKELGDGCLLIFNSAYDALRFSIHIQKLNVFQVCNRKP